MILHQFAPSGNCYKIRLVAALLELPLTTREWNILKGATRTAEFLGINPNGRVPVLELDDGRQLAESNAIIEYLAFGSELIPTGRFARAQMRQWMFFEQYQVEPTIAVLRFWKKYQPGIARSADVIAEKESGAHAAMELLNSHLKNRQWVVGDRQSLADIALYGYLCVAEEASLKVSKYPNLTAWRKRIAAEPGYISISE